jgi:hypothetical protein
MNTVDPMTENLNIDSLKKLVALIGRDGAICGLEKSKKIDVQKLLSLAKELGISTTKKPTKKKLSEQIVRLIDKRINKSIDELKSMDKEELVSYFQSVDCDQEELLDFLESIEFKAKAKSKRALIEYAAIQIQGLGIYERIADTQENDEI